MRPFYYSLNEYLRDTYGTKLYKLSLDGGMSCPNRDGLIDTRGCIFCSKGGSGEFTGAALLHNKCDIDTQINLAKQLISQKYKGNEYIAYFQSYTNTYADTDYLRNLFYSVIKRPDIKILSIATRPDCLGPDVINLLNELNRIKPVWVELGLQSVHENTARYIRRGYSLDVFKNAMNSLLGIGIKPIIHMIIGLPFETDKMMLETADYIGHCGAGGIKLQLLHVLKDTDLAAEYENKTFEAMSLTEYIQLLGKIIEILPKEMVIHRLTGDGAKRLLIAPKWSADKKHVINSINRYFKDNNICQGRNYR